MNIYLRLININQNILIKYGIYHRTEEYSILEMLTTMEIVTGNICISLYFILLKFHNVNIMREVL